MLWLQYFTEDFLFDSSTEELIKKRDELKQELELQQAEYLQKQNEVVQKLEVTLNWFIKSTTHLVKSEELLRKITLFKARMKDAKDVVQLAAVIREHITALIPLEKNSNIPKEDSLSDRLAEQHEALCFYGTLPRIFSTQVRPKLLENVAVLRKNFIKESAKAFSSHTTAQLAILQMLESRLAESPTEDLAKEYIDEAMKNAQNLIEKEKRETLSFVYATKSFAGIDNNQRLKDKLIALKQQAENKGYLKLPSQFSIKWQSLNEAITRLDIQIELNNFSAEEQKNRCIAAHTKAFNVVSAHPFSQTSEIGQYITSQAHHFKTIPNRVDITQKDAFKNLNEKYTRFWKNLAVKVNHQAYLVKNKQSNNWKVIHKQVSQARSVLQTEGHLTTCFTEDKRPIILKKYDQIIKDAYRNTLFKPGDDRYAELQHTRILLCSVTTEEEASKIIYKHAEEIDQSHKLYSFSYNFVPMRSGSRAAEALLALATECEAEGLLPQQQPNMPSEVYKRLRKAESDYFSQDIIYSNPAARYITVTLLRFTQLIEARLASGDLKEPDAQQIIADAIETAIDKAQNLEASTKVERKFTLLFTRKMGLSTVLIQARDELNKAKVIPISYQMKILPKIVQKLEAAKRIYESKTDISPAELANNGKEQGLNAIGQMIGRVRNALNREQATQLLKFLIRSCDKDDSPALVQILKESLQELVDDKILPDLSVSELTDAAIKLQEDYDKVAQAYAIEAGIFARIGNHLKSKKSSAPSPQPSAKNTTPPASWF